MNLIVLLASSLVALAPTPGVAASPRVPSNLTPQQKDSLIEWMGDSGQAAAEASFIVACMTVTRDAKQRRVTVYADSPPASPLYREGEYQIEVIYDRELAALVRRVNGAYAQHHNSNVLTFAAAEYLKGRTNVALRVMEILATASPKTGWYPSDGSPFVPAASIVARLRSNDGTLKDYLELEASQWAWWNEKYAPKAQPELAPNGSPATSPRSSGVTEGRHR